MGDSARLKRIVLAAMLLALCVVGANIKIMGSIAFDSMPAFLGAILLGPWFGAFLGVFGHLTSAAMAGFPLTLPIHLIIGCMMGVCMFVFGWIRQRFGKDKLSIILLSDIVGYIINTPLEVPLLYPLLHGAIFALFVPLTAATIFNIVIAEIIYAFLPKNMKHASFLRSN
ncbi:MAG TPA: ECF transporter S component [Lactobacillus sp.]|nr:ECF transporter S component [Lactobacillus sp.]